MPTAAPAHAQQQHQTMQCMEIWGGNQLVDTSVVMPGLDAWVYSKPYGGSAEGGGDVHYVSSCATGRVARLLVADVSGHGAQVCDVAGSLRTLMRRYVNFIDQAEFVRSMNDQFVTMSASNCFATAIVTTFFAPTNALSLCNAGHPPPLLYRAKPGTWEFLEAEPDDPDTPSQAEQDSVNEETNPSNIPLGVQELADYEQFEVTLAVGDLVLCYTDSLIEARDAAGELLGQEGLLAIVRQLDATSVTTLIPSLLAATAALRPGNLDGDDVTVLLFRPTSDVGTTPGMRDRLLAPVRIARGVLGSFRAGGEPAPLPEFTLSHIGGWAFASLNRLWRGSRGSRVGARQTP